MKQQTSVEQILRDPWWALRVSLIYAVSAALWILFSNTMLAYWLGSPQEQTLFATLKGWAFVAVTATLLYLLLRGRHRDLESPRPPSAWHNLWRPLTLAALLTAGITSAVVLFLMQREAHEHRRDLGTVAELKTQQVENWVTERLLSAGLHGTSFPQAELYRRWREEGDSVAGERLALRLTQFAEAGRFAAASLLNPEGRLLWSSSAAEQADWFSEEQRAEILAMARSGETGIVGPYLDLAGKVQLSFVATLPLEGRPRPIVLLHIGQDDYLPPALRGWPVPSETGEIVLFRQDGDEIVFLTTLRDAPDQILLRRAVSHEHLLVSQLASHGGNELRIVEGMDYRGVRVSGAGRAINGTNWFLLAKQDEAEWIAAAIQRVSWAVLGGILFFLAIGATLVLSRQRRSLEVAQAVQQAQAERLEALHISETRFRSLFEEVANIAVQGYDEERRVIFWNRASETLYGFSAAEALGQRVEELIIPPSMRDEIQALSPETFAAGKLIPRGELELRRKDGTPVRVYADHASRINSAGKMELYSLDVDLTDLRQAEERLAQAAGAFENTAEDVTVTDTEGTILFVNRAFTEITGYEEHEALGQNRSILQSERHDRSFHEALWTTLKETGRWQGEIWNRRKDGQLYPAWMTISSVKDATGEITRYVAVSRDVSQLRRFQEERNFLAYHDPLTGMPNRLLLRDRMEQAIERVQHQGGGLAVLFLDLDRFKNVNDSLGHEAGDDLLRQLAQRISTLIQGHDTLARLGGDEFVVLLEEGAKGTTARVRRLAKALATMLERPFGFETRELFLTASIGIGLYPNDGSDPNELLRNAEAAMYRAKAEGRNTLQFYQQGMVADSLDRLTIENDLRRALSRKEFLLHYQPQVDLNTGALAGVEALVRWNHPERGLIPPASFIPLAEEMGIIGDIGDWVLLEACQQMTTWHADGLAVPRMAVNLSVQQLERGVLADRVSEVLARCHMAAAELELEVTESMIMRQTERAIGTLRSLRALGVAIAVDDFGTGYSSLGYIQRLPLNRLKIDRAFVKDLAESADDRTIARAIIGLTKSLGLEVIAEGVETQEQADFLRHEGCHLGQGYLFGQPIPAEQLAAAWMLPERLG